MSAWHHYFLNSISIFAVKVIEPERVFPDLKTEKQQETVQKIVDGLARNSDLEEKDYDDLVDQMEMFLAHAKKKKNSK